MESKKVKEILGRLHCKLLGDRKNEINHEEINCVGEVITLINELEKENKSLYDGYHEGYKVGYYYGKQDAHSADRAEPTTNNSETEADCGEFDRGYIVGKVHGMLSMFDTDDEVGE